MLLIFTKTNVFDIVRRIWRPQKNSYCSDIRFQQNKTILCFHIEKSWCKNWKLWAFILCIRTSQNESKKSIVPEECTTVSMLSFPPVNTTRLYEQNISTVTGRYLQIITFSVSVIIFTEKIWSQNNRNTFSVLNIK